MMEAITDIVSWILLCTGGIAVLIGGIGALRMPELYTRMHAASVTDSLGTILILTGVMFQAGLSLATIKLVAILLFVMLTNPTSSNALASAALLAGTRPMDSAPGDENSADDEDLPAGGES